MSDSTTPTKLGLIRSIREQTGQSMVWSKKLVEDIEQMVRENRLDHEPKSLRDEFAMASIDASMNNFIALAGKGQINPSIIAFGAYQIADAMMEARKQ